MDTNSKDKHKTKSFTLLRPIYQFPNKSVHIQNLQSLSLSFDVTEGKRLFNRVPTNT